MQFQKQSNLALSASVIINKLIFSKVKVTMRMQIIISKITMLVMEEVVLQLLLIQINHLKTSKKQEVIRGDPVVQMVELENQMGELEYLKVHMVLIGKQDVQV